MKIKPLTWVPSALGRIAQGAGFFYSVAPIDNMFILNKNEMSGVTKSLHDTEQDAMSNANAHHRENVQSWLKQ